MKIISLRFKNLNSLAGEWHIDFTAPEYVMDGIFAITGPTGSGKSTILDALSLALYGQTPRLGRITKSSNEIMSRQTGECFSEVVFETLTGRYRCHWSQHRSRRQSGGELQTQKHEIAEDASGKIIESKLQDTLAAVVTRTGMDFQQFTRSMLLAQGGFAAFLQAPSDERAPVLEQITGTEIYSVISMRVHERNRFEQQKLKALREECTGIQLLDDERLAATDKELQARLNEESDIISRQNKAETALRWLKQIAAMKGELEGMEESFRELRIYEDRFIPDRRRMEQARLAAAFEPAYTTLHHLQELQKSELQEKIVLESTLEDAKTALAERTEAFSEAVQRQQNLKVEEKKLSVVVREVRALDLQISVKQEQCREQEEAITLLCDQIASLEKLIGSIEGEMQQERKKIDESAAYLDQHEADNTLLSSMSGIEAAVRQQHEAQEEECTTRTTLEQRRKELGEAEALLQKLQPETAEARAALDASHTRREELTGELASLLAGVDISQLRRESESLHERMRALETLAARVAAAGEIGERISLLKQALADSDARHSRTVEEIERHTQLQQKEVQIVEGLERQAELLSKILSLDEERRLLQDGSPCPLCGSVNHPWAEESPEMVVEGDELRLSKVSLQETTDKITALRVEAAKTSNDREHHERQIIAEEKALAGERAAWNNLAAELGIAGELNHERAVAIFLAIRSQAAERAEALAGAEQLETRQKLAEREEQQLRQQLTDAVQREEAAVYSKKTSELEVRRGKESLGKSSDRRTTLQESLNRQLAGYGITSEKETSYRNALLVLHTRAEEWQRAIDRKTAAFRQIGALEGNLKAQKELLLTRTHDHGERVRQHVAGKTTCTLLQEQRQELFGEKNPDKTEEILAERLKIGEASLELARSSRDASSQQIGELSARIGMLATSSAGRALDIAETHSLLIQELARVGFESIECFIAARLERHVQEKLEERAQKLAARRLELETLQSERKSKLMHEEKMALTEESPQALQDELERLSVSFSAVRSDIEALKHQLFEHEKAAALLREKTAALAVQQIEGSRWATLYELIGSADGKKYRNFAQGLTFDIMIGHANRQLVNMSDRYLLVRSADHPLGLNVIDNYQAGEVRSTLNLSGGESFIVSLALALGLSQMSSRNVRVDSLFLDEGFGTLDEDALDTALQTLAALQQNGKIIGIISHVPALKERISTQIRVHPISGGRSRLSGPAVSEI